MTNAASKDQEPEPSQSVADLLVEARRAQSRLDWECAIALYSQAIDLTRSGSRSDAAALYSLFQDRAHCAELFGDLALLHSDGEAMVRLAQALGDDRRSGQALLIVAGAATGSGDLRSAQELAAEALRLARATGDEQTEADALVWASRAATSEMDLDTHIALTDRALAIYRRVGDTRGEGRAIAWRALPLARTGKIDLAHNELQQALQTARRGGDRFVEARLLNSLGIVTNDGTRGRDCYEQASAVNSLVGDLPLQSLIHNNLSLIYTMLGLYDRACELVTHAVRFQRERGLLNVIAFSLDSLARAELLAGRLDLARQHYQEGLACCQEAGITAGYFDLGLGWIALAEGHPETALDLIAAAESAFGAQRTADVSTAQAWRGAAYLALGDVTRALECSAGAVASLQTYGTAGEFPAQSIWWWRYQALRAAGQADAAWEALDQARVVLLDGVAALTDDGLRRCYFGKVQGNRDIIRAWLSEAQLRGQPLAALTGQLSGPAGGQEQFRRLLDIGVRLNARRDSNDLPQAILDEVAELTGAEHAALFVADEQGAQRLAAQIGASKTGYAFKNEAEQKRAPLLRYLPDGAPELEQRSILAVPLIASGQVAGLLHCELSGQVGRFTTDDRDLLSLLANQAAVALENAHWADTLERRVEQRTAELQEANTRVEQRAAELAIVNSVGEAMASQLDVDTIVRIVGDKVRAIFQTEANQILLYDEARGVINVAYSFDRGIYNPPDSFPYGQGLTSRVIASRRPLVLNDATQDDALGVVTLFSTAGQPEQTRSYMAVPIIVGDRVIGVADVQSYRENAYDETSVRLLSTLSNSMGVAIENARLFQETKRLLAESEQRAAELAIINRVQQGLAAQIDMQGIYDLVGDEIRRIFDAEVVALASADVQSNTAHTHYLMEKGQRFYPAPSGLGAVGRTMLATRQPVRMNTPAELEACGSQTVPGTEPVKSALWVPLLVGGQARGAITLQSVTQEHAFSDADVRLLTTLASSMSIALENARLFAETKRLLAETEQRAAELATVNTISRAVSSEVELTALIRLIGEQMRQTFKADIAYVALLDRERHRIDFPYAYGDALTSIPLGEGLTSRILESGQPLLENRDVEARRTELGASLVGTPSMSYLGVPILVTGQAIGVLSVQSTHEQGRFGEDDQHLLTTIAGAVGSAIQNARLYQETQRHAEEMATLAEIGSDIASTHELQPVLERIAARSMELLRVRDIAIMLIQPDGVTMRADVALGLYVEETKAATWQVGQNLCGSVAATGVAELINYPERDPRAANIAGTPTPDEEQEGMMIAPLTSRGKVIGVMAVWRLREQGFFAGAELDLLVSLARQAAIAIESARLYMETERRAYQMSTIAEVGRELSATLDLNTVLESLATHVHRLFGAQDTVLRLVGEDGRTFRTQVALGQYAKHFLADTITLGHGITGSIAQSGIAEVIDNPYRDPRGVHVPGTPEEEESPETLMCAPLVAAGRTIGLLSVYRDRREGLFSQVDLDFLVGLGRQAAIAIENARLFTEAEQQRTSALESQRRLADIIDFLPDATLVISREGKVIAWNRAIEEMTGVPAADILGKGDYVYSVPFYNERRPILVDLVWQPATEIEARYAHIHRVGEILVGEARVPSLRGEERFLYATASALHDSRGQVVGAIEVIRDITDRKTAEEELRDAKAAADTANEAKSAFLAMMSHEIRTPMNAIIGMSGLLLDTPLNADQRDFAETIRTSGDALLTIINDILDFSKIEAGRMDLEQQPFDLRECIESSLDLMRLRASQKGLELAYQMEPDVPEAIVGDVTRLRQILVNLLGNAVKFTEAGEVVVTVESVARGSGYEVHFAVRDTGIGIPADRLDRLFHAFSQVDASTARRYGGTGLGLAISQRLSELMGGRMWVQSEGIPGKGSTFHFTLVAQAAPAIKQRAHLSAQQPQLQGKRLLLVDDNATNRRILVLQARAWGMVTRDTASSREALAWVQQGAPFDLAVLDMNMPDLDGVALATAIRALRSAELLPLVLFSSLGGHEAGLPSGLFAAHLAKPLRPSALLDTLMNVLGAHVHAAAEAPATAASLLDPETAIRRPLRILLAEDNAVNQKLALRLLSQMGYRADVAANGLEVIRSVERQPYDVILMDVQMPEMDGIEASRILCARWPRGVRPHIIATTANAMQGDAALCLEAGMDDYVSKPIRVDELVAALAKVVPLPRKE